MPKAKKPTPLKKVSPLTFSGLYIDALQFVRMYFSVGTAMMFVYDSQVILKEREERKQRRLLEERGLLPENECETANDAAEEEQEQCDTNATGERKHVKQYNSVGFYCKLSQLEVDSENHVRSS